MRALVERQTATAKDDWGAVAAPAFTSIGDALPCFVWSDRASEVTDGRKNAEIETYRAMFALGADLRPRDQIASVTDRQGNEVLPGRLEVLGPVQRKHTHLECTLRRIA